MVSKMIYEKRCALYARDGKCAALSGDKVTCGGCAFYKTKFQQAADVAKCKIRLAAMGSEAE